MKIVRAKSGIIVIAISEAKRSRGGGGGGDAFSTYFPTDFS